MDRMAQTVLNGIDEVRAAVGRHLGYSDWMEITQARIDQFAEATGDDQWIHVDPVRAADGPFGATIAHGYLTLALTNLFLPQILDVQGVSMGVNYGANKAAVPVTGHGRLEGPRRVPSSSRSRRSAAACRRPS